MAFVQCVSGWSPLSPLPPPTPPSNPGTTPSSLLPTYKPTYLPARPPSFSLSLSVSPLSSSSPLCMSPGASHFPSPILLSSVLLLIHHSF